MKKIIIITALAAAMIINCKSNASQPGADAVYISDTSQVEDTSSTGNRAISNESPGVFSDVTGKEWKLVDIYLVNSRINFDREELTQKGFTDIFTLKFEGEMVSGKGEPNRYSAPYTTGDNRNISIMPMRSTLMASILPNEKLNEYEFFLYLQNVYEWKLIDKNLELFSKTADGGDVRLVWIASE